MHTERHILRIGLLIAMLASAATLAVGSYAATDLAVQNDVPGKTFVQVLDQHDVVVTDPDNATSTNFSAQVLAANKALEPLAPTASPPQGLSLAASGAGWLLVVCLLGLAGLNTRKRPLRFPRATPERHR